MAQSQEINELATALAKAQASVRNPSKDKHNPHFKSKYADLAAGLECILPALSEHGLSVVQIPDVKPDMLILRTRLMHASGQWIEGDWLVARLNGGQLNPQMMGSALTYARRQSLFAMVGIAGADDDDGNEAAAVSAPAKKDPLDERISHAQAEKLMSEIVGAGANVKKLLAYFKLDDLREFTVRDLQSVNKMLDDVRASRKAKNDAA